MHSFSTILVSIAALSSSLVQAAPQQARGITLANRSPLAKRDTNCNGSVECYENMGDDYCDKARSYIKPDVLYHTRGSAEETGVCWGICGIFVEGDDCDLSGKEMDKGVKDIWGGGGCEACGQKIYEDGCILTINYVAGCDPNENM